MWRIPRPGRHPLGVAVGDEAAAADRVLVPEGPVDHVGHRLEAAVGVPRRALGLARGVLHLAHLVHVDERVEDGPVHAGEGPADREPLPFESAGRGGHAQHRLDRASAAGPVAPTRGRVSTSSTVTAGMATSSLLPGRARRAVARLHPSSLSNTSCARNISGSAAGRSRPRLSRARPTDARGRYAGRGTCQETPGDPATRRNDPPRRRRSRRRSSELRPEAVGARLRRAAGGARSRPAGRPRPPGPAHHPARGARDRRHGRPARQALAVSTLRRYATFLGLDGDALAAADSLPGQRRPRPGRRRTSDGRAPRSAARDQRRGRGDHRARPPAGLHRDG